MLGEHLCLLFSTSKTAQLIYLAFPRLLLSQDWSTRFARSPFLRRLVSASITHPLHPIFTFRNPLDLARSRARLCQRCLFPDLYWFVPISFNRTRLSIKLALTTPFFRSSHLSGVFSFFADAYERYSSSAQAAQSLLRNLFGQSPLVPTSRLL